MHDADCRLQCAHTVHRGREAHKQCRFYNPCQRCCTMMFFEAYSSPTCVRDWGVLARVEGLPSTSSSLLSNAVLSAEGT